MENHDVHEMDEATRAFVDRLGIWFELERLPRIAGQLLGLLLVSREDRSLDEIAQRLAVSKASVSSNARLLERLGMVVRVAHAGDRRDFYRIVDCGPALLQLRIALLRELREIMAAGLRTPEAEDGTIRGRLEEAGTSLEGAIEGLTALSERMRALRAVNTEGADDARRAG